MDLQPSAADDELAWRAILELPGRGSAQDVVASWLAARKALLVLDNCEHLVADCATFSQRALERCTQLNIATSREPLGVPGEARWPVAPLRDPDAVQLFEARARLVSPDFKMATGNLEPVTRICERLDRLPLAIEMAAARLDVMSEQELLTNLNDRFRFLTSGTRTAPQRQQTMAAAIDWSYRLLTDHEARLFRRLAVFQGGFTAEGAGAVCSDGIETNLIDVLARLVQKSMVVADRLDSGTRFRLLESHHDFASERLRESGELDAMQKSHFDYFNSRHWEACGVGQLLARGQLGPGQRAGRWLGAGARDRGFRFRRPDACQKPHSGFARTLKAERDAVRQSHDHVLTPCVAAGRSHCQQKACGIGRIHGAGSRRFQSSLHGPSTAPGSCTKLPVSLRSPGQNVRRGHFPVERPAHQRLAVDFSNAGRGLLALVQGDPGRALEISTRALLSEVTRRSAPPGSIPLESLANAQQSRRCRSGRRITQNRRVRLPCRQ